MPDPCRIAAVRYLNTIPLIEGLDACRGLTLRTAPPSALGAMLREDEADIALVSVADTLDQPGTPSLTLLPVGMIASDGPTMTVRLVSRVPIEQIEAIACDDESRTSVELCRCILRERFDRTPNLLPSTVADWIDDPARRREIQAALLIGDKVVSTPPMDDFPYQLDLGEQWQTLVNLPFVYAMWACRRGEETRLRDAIALLARQRARNAMRLEWLVSTRAPAYRWPVPAARRYLTRLLRFDPDGRALEGLRIFLERLEANGSGTVPLICDEWIPEAAPSR